MRIKTAASRVGHGILSAATALHNAQIDEQIEEIDDKIEVFAGAVDELNERRAALHAQKI